MRDINYLLNKGVDVKASLDIFGDILIYDQNLDIYIDELITKLEQLRKVKELGDMTHYSIYVHSIKSSAKFFGFERLAKLALEHENKSKDNDLFFVCGDYENLSNEIKNMILISSNYLGKEINIKPVVLDKTKTILVADDSIVIRNYVKKLMKEYDILLATNGLNALEVIESDIKIQGVILDLNMPVLDGIAVLQYFTNKDLFQKIPVIIITGEEDKSVLDQLKIFPIVDTIKKPFSEVSIKSAVNKLLLKIGDV
ncbi:MAG: response regulator [Mycoplasmatota bacterium]